MTKIADESFCCDSDLFSVTLPNTLTFIGMRAFSASFRLQSVTIPRSVTHIGGETFYFTNLRSVEIPDRVTSIAWGMFRACESLENVTIPDSVTSIEGEVFVNCVRLKHIHIPEGVSVIGNYTFSGCQSLESVTIPNSVTGVGFRAFYDCLSLTNLAFPSGLAVIGEAAFSGCSHLKSVSFDGNAPQVYSGIFDGTDQVTVYYQYGTTGWESNFAGRPTRMSSFVPVVTNPLDLGVVTEGSILTLKAQLAGSPKPSIQWFFNGDSIAGATNETLNISKVTVAYAGDYTVVASNILGTVTNGPSTLGVNNVTASNFVGLVVTDPPGTSLKIQSAAQIHGAWTPLADWVLTNSPAVFIDFSATNAGQRFYQTTASGGLSVWMFPAWNFTAPEDSKLKIEYVNAEVGFTNWQFLTNLTVPSSPYLFIDTSATNKWQRFYRTTPVP